MHRALLSPFLAFLYDVGAPVERGLSQAGLPTEIPEDGELYLSTRACGEFVSHMGRLEGIPDIGLKVTQRVGIDGLSSALSKSIRMSRTLYQALQVFRDCVHHESTHCKLRLVAQGGTSYLYHRGSFPDDAPGQIEATWWRIGILLAIFRRFLGPGWNPVQMGVPTDGSAAARASGRFCDTRFVPSVDEHWIAIPRQQMISQRGPRPSHSLSAAKASLRASAKNAHDFVWSLRQLLPAYLAEGSPNIELAAGLAGTSVRTLQRRLADRCLAYSGLVQQVRFDRAEQLLRQEGMKVIDAAYETGYSDPAHFARAFRRIAGLSPREYQQHLAGGTSRRSASVRWDPNRERATA
jgi:AraC-like DNA-binding protein